MHLTVEAQSTIDLIKQLNVSSDLNWIELPTPQPFIILGGCDDNCLIVQTNVKLLGMPELLHST